MSTARAIRIHQHGDTGVMQLESIALPAPGPGEVLLRQHAIGLNFIDVYQRTGLYPLQLPSGLGQEAAGVVEAIGDGVTEVAVGDRAAYAGGAPGAYADLRVMPAGGLVKLPDAVDFETAAAMMLKGLTAQYLLRQTYPVKSGDRILVHAAAGGVGLLLCQWARELGATVIGTVGSDDKAKLAHAHGCEHPVVYTRENFVERVREITAGRGVHVVYDSVGKATFMDSLACLRPRGMMVSFGNATGAVPAFEPGLLARMGSLFLTRPTLGHYADSRAALLAMSEDLFALVTNGKLRVNVMQRYALDNVAAAHAALESRNTTGSSVILP